ncbi:methionine/alanine import NSS transporter subunit MetS [Corynebacterium falsenii]|uniref:Methionine/alanine import NSS transporter subunit MetS n=1 Tax=Corynebacterium falsenii TaxID=108486 RepID=A0A418Q5A4_9CORY|nr:methionine/alanine import NSS transporter subunit MetS [Corynebacterium falsenii]AHI03557.1 amino acid transporter [Corynebacterium falsenii DSM 44353]RIX33748.1 methionine/alanine import NSS transporter subunit MetS [Corynebacterium falsenii]UBI04273.1 methionine/alanine import NSS transporter subunit MetS [Corynebacterium falsenii]UBI07683.1 methionine/alanine import NSS transporter subunit MetS [Corynebacterium falsenii]HJF11365.1 methionine/alanine import NSS transporter subunit MetS [C
MTAPAILLMVLFILVIWGGLVASVILLSNNDDETSGELGNAPGTDDETLMHQGAATM